MIKTLIVDDEPPSRRVLRDLLLAYPSFEVIGEADNGVTAVDGIAQLKPDLVFLDVQMPGMDGFDVLKEIGPEHMPAVVFVTAFSQYTLQAFEVHAMDYLVKPIHPDRFRETLRHVQTQLLVDRRMLASHLSTFIESLTSKSAYASRFVIRNVGHIEIVQTHRIQWIEAERDYVIFHSDSGKHLMREGIGSVESKLDPAEFLRIHRSYIVRLSMIKEVKSGAGGDQRVVMNTGTILPVGRTYQSNLARVL